MTNVIIGDINAKVGEEVAYCVGRYRLEERSVRGNVLIEFCISEELIIAFNSHKKVKEINLVRNNTTTILKNDNGRIIKDMKEKLMK